MFIGGSSAAYQNLPQSEGMREQSTKEYESMDQPTAAALHHIRQMERRISQQSTLIAELRQSGKDTGEAASRLQLLRNALEEMRIQLLGLLPTESQDRLKAAR
jgi:hypothetical protein